MNEDRIKFENHVRRNSEKLQAFTEIEELNKQIQNNFQVSSKSEVPFPLFEENPHENENPYYVQYFDITGGVK